MPNAVISNLVNEKINIGLGEPQRAEIVDTLNKLLADEFLLYTKTRKYHWNVRGPRFHTLHVFFETQYEQLDTIMDDVAENVRQFGGLSHGTMKEFIGSAHLKEQPGENPDENGMLGSLLADHEEIIRYLRQSTDRADELGAVEAADFLTGLIEQHNKMAWMLRSHL